MKTTFLFAVTAMLAFTSIASAQLVFDGGPDGTGTDFFDEANWVDTDTGLDPPADTVNPLEVTNGLISGGITNFDLTISGDFAVEAVGVDDIFNIRLNSGLTLTLEDNATLSCQFLTANAGQEINVVLSDNSELTTERIVRTAFEISESASLLFVGTSPEFAFDRLNLSSDWTGCVTTQLPNGNRQNLIGDDGAGLFNDVTVDGEAVTNEDFETIQFGASVIHTLGATPFLLGDVNRDEVVDFLDISPFIEILALSGFLDEADIDRSGTVDFLDISPFITILSNL